MIISGLDQAQERVLLVLHYEYRQRPVVWQIMVMSELPSEPITDAVLALRKDGLIDWNEGYGLTAAGTWAVSKMEKRWRPDLNCPVDLMRSFP